MNESTIIILALLALGAGVIVAVIAILRHGRRREVIKYLAAIHKPSDRRRAAFRLLGFRADTYLEAAAKLRTVPQSKYPEGANNEPRSTNSAWWFAGIALGALLFLVALGWIAETDQQATLADVAITNCIKTQADDRPAIASCPGANKPVVAAAK